MEKKIELFKVIVFLLGFFILFSVGCKKSSETNTSPAHETGTMTDIENNVYKTVKIGNQWWMAEDLKVQQYRDGTYLNLLQSNASQWSMDTTGACCDSRDPGGIVDGKFYNWFAINNPKNLAPSGWHIPTDNEWKELEKYVGMNQGDADKTGWRGTNEGDKLKIAAPDGWTAYETVWGTNESGFTALAIGCRLFNGGLADPGFHSTGFWWCASGQSQDEAWYRYLDYKNSNIFRSHCYKNYGFSVRCVKD